jgi:DeoR family transcriptional regulator of aga operon
LYEPFRFDAAFQNREIHRTKEKRRIAAAAAEMIKEHETVGFTAGTTTTRVARNIRHRANITVITNALNIGMELCNMPGIRTSVTGGEVRWAWSFSMAGEAAIDFLKERFMDKLFLGMTGIDAERGPTVNEPEEAATFRAMVRQAREIIAVADSSKLGIMSAALICPIESVKTLVTDTGASDEMAAAFTNRGVRVLRV